MGKQDQWLVLNKMDLIPEDIREEYCEEVLKRLDWQGKVFRVSGHVGEGCDILCAEIMDYLDEVKATEKVALEQQKIAAQEAVKQAALLKE